MTWYERYRALNIDGSALGLGPGVSERAYPCTPLGAEVIGWEGVDGVHYCFVRGCGDMVFAVEPMEQPGREVRPLAAGFRDFLRLLLACGGAGAAQQAHLFDGPESFEKFLRQNPPDEKRQAALDALTGLGLTPMENPWQYIHGLQAGFDSSRLRFSREYRELVGENSTKPEEKPWEVYYDGNFWGHHGKDRPGKEVPVGKTFPWGTAEGLIPAVYLCGKGLVVDVCLSVPGERMKAWLEKWSAAEDGEARRRIAEANPINMDLQGEMEVNGRTLRLKHGCGTAWYPQPPEGEKNGEEARRVLEHYHLNPERAWVFRRMCFPWATKQRPAALGTMTLTLAPEEAEVPGPVFTAEAGKTVPFTHPVTGTQHILTVREVERQQLPEEHLTRMPEGWEWPRWYEAVSCTASPELPEGKVFLRDRSRGGQPRRLPESENRPAGGAAFSAFVGVIGGADGPTAVFFTGIGKEKGKRFGGCSSMYFTPPERVEWKLIFRRRPWEAVRLELKDGGGE